MSKINNSLNLFIDTYSYYHKNRLSESFSKWNFMSQTLKSLENLEPKIIEKYNKKLSEKTKEINNQIKAKENANNALKKKINELNETIAKYKKTLKQNEEKEELLNKNIKTLERDNSKLEQEIKNNESLYDSGIDNRKEQLENKIQELEITLKNLEDDLRDQEQYLTNYSKEMNEMLGYFEKKLEEKEALKNNIDNEFHQKHSKIYFFNFFNLDSKNQSNSNSQSMNYKINVLNHANQQKTSYKTSGQSNNSSRGIFINTSNNYNSKK